MGTDQNNLMFDIPPAGEFGETVIHPTAIVEKGAELGRGVKVGPYSIVGPHAKIGDGVIIQSHCVVENRTTIGERTVVYPFSTLGVKPQDLKYTNEDAELIIGKCNSIRQYCNFSIGTNGDNCLTSVGDHNLFMVYTHVGHDSVVLDHCVLANGVSLGGHVHVDSGAIIGGHSAVHQFCRVGKMAFAAGGSMITQDVPPYCLVHGNRAAVNGLNVVGLRRQKISRDDLGHVKSMYKMLFKENMTQDDCVAKIKETIPDSIFKNEFLEFLSKSERGLCR